MSNKRVIAICDAELPVADIVAVIRQAAQKEMVFLLDDGVKFAAMFDTEGDLSFSWTEVRKALRGDDFVVTDTLQFRPYALVALNVNKTGAEPALEFVFNGLALLQPYASERVRDEHHARYALLLAGADRPASTN